MFAWEGFSVLVGYARVSTIEQDPAYQLQALKEHGCERIFQERCSARSRDRAQLTAAMDHLRAGDALVVWKLDRLGRSLSHLIGLAVSLGERGCQLVSLTEALDTRTAGGQLVFNVFGAIAQFESALNRERTMEGLAAARAAGRRGGRPATFHNPENIKLCRSMLRDPGLRRVDIARHFGIHKNTLYRWFPGGDPDAYDGKRHGAGCE